LHFQAAPFTIQILAQIRKFGGPLKKYLRLIVSILALSSVLTWTIARATAPTTITQDPLWKKSLELTEKQQFQAALEPMESLKDKLKGTKTDPMGLAIVLAQLTKYKIALHGVETALRDLKAEPWPQEIAARLLLEMMYSQSLIQYQNYYNHEIQGRTKLETKDLDLKEMTTEQIFTEALSHLLNIWEQRQQLFSYAKNSYPDFITPNSFPDQIKGTFFDSYIELLKSILVDTRGWSPLQSNEVFQLKVADLIRGNKVDFLNPQVHPLQKIAYLLKDQTEQHLKLGQNGAAFQSRLELFELLFQHLTSKTAQSEIMAELERSLNQFKADAWYSMGLATKADFIRRTDSPDNLIEARKIAELGIKSFPTSPGANRCRDIVKQITQPQLRLEAMMVDGPGRSKSLDLGFANTKKVFLRAFAFNAKKSLIGSKDYNILPNYDEAHSIVRGKPSAEWSVDLPETVDYKTHQYFTNLPKLKKGNYLVVASLNAAFSKEQNMQSGIFTTISDLVLSHRQLENGKLEVYVRQGNNGAAEPGVEVTLYQFDYQKGHQKVSSGVTSSTGLFSFSKPNDKNYSNYFVIAEKGENFLFSSNGLYFNDRVSNTQTSSPIFLYSDRSIYRPEQKLLWKVIAFTGSSEKGQYQPRRNDKLSVELRDANRQVVETKTVTTDQFGSAFGEFVIPKGRLLGSWSLSSSGRLYQIPIKVEEYKRPTFEVLISESKEPLRFNHVASLSGEAKYYFGMPVTNGKLKYRVYRSGILPLWSRWCYWDWGFFTKDQLVDSGTTELNSSGQFQVHFQPKADANLEKKPNGKINTDLSYNYRLELDLTDEGGETRTATKSFAIGFVTVKASVQNEQGFIRENLKFSMNISRTNLSGTDRAGEGEWTIAPLIEPQKVLTPAEVTLPEEFLQFSQKIRIPSDEEIPRYQSRYDWELFVRSWQPGKILKSGRIKDPSLEIPGLPPGIYRFTYKTKDDFNVPVETIRHFIVAGAKSQFKLPFFMALEKYSVSVGGKIRAFINTGFNDQPLIFERFHANKRQDHRILVKGQIIEMDAKETDKGGSSFLLSFLRDFQSLDLQQNLIIPWDEKELKLEWSTFRDKVRPGDKESWELTIRTHDKRNLQANAAQVLTYMYDRSLDFFTLHQPQNPLSVYPTSSSAIFYNVILGQAQTAPVESDYFQGNEYSPYTPDRPNFYFNYGVGGPGSRGRFGGAMYPDEEGNVMAMAGSALPMSTPPQRAKLSKNDMTREKKANLSGTAQTSSDEESQSEKSLLATAPQIRTNFQETAFWYPDLVTNKNGAVKVKFTVPDSLTSWNVWAVAVTQDLKAGILNKSIQTIKELMVRPYLPRFFREGDKVEVKVVINNSGDKVLNGDLRFAIKDSASKRDLSASYKLKLSNSKFTAPPKSSSNVTASLSVPNEVGAVEIEVVAKSTTGFSDGEKREIPVIPGRIHLAQSKFKILKDKSAQTMSFKDLAENKDPSLINEQMVVTLDAQLFYSVLASLPYLINYPYECIEQTLNRFVSTGILTSIFDQFPSVARMARSFSNRKTPLETWDNSDPNRKISFEETPWLQQSRGHLVGSDGTDPDLISVLDPKIAKLTKTDALAKLQKAQTSLGAFPWFPGGPPSPYITLYTLYGLSKAIEFGVEVPKPMVQNAWNYLKTHYIQEILPYAIAHNCCWEEITFLNYVLSNYKDNSWGSNVFTAEDRKKMLDLSFGHWKDHSPYLKGYLSLTLLRMNRKADGQLVWASVMDSAKTSEDEGTHWADEDRSWLWYNDTIETHAFALRAGMELGTTDKQLDGMVLWLFLNKKLNHWKSTRATAEVIYSLTHYLKKTAQLGVRESAKVQVNDVTKDFVFEPDKYTGKQNQIIIPGEKITSKTAVKIEKTTPGYMFASTTWHFSTTQMPAESRGDFLQVDRKYFKRDIAKSEMTLTPLIPGKTPIKVGDELEVQISIRSKHAMEYVHLRDPRPSGFEPTTFTSSHKWDLGLYWFEEIRDTGTNFFFEHIPQGQYTFKYRIRATSAGEYTSAPATLAPMYAPEFTAYSTGDRLKVQ
jgi:uncharacterized protein YfaS (alpha-2-macroglobulin family)